MHDLELADRPRLYPRLQILAGNPVAILLKHHIRVWLLAFAGDMGAVAEELVRYLCWLCRGFELRLVPELRVGPPISVHVSATLGPETPIDRRGLIDSTACTQQSNPQANSKAMS